jgi:hypothetical protein
MAERHLEGRRRGDGGREQERRERKDGEGWGERRERREKGEREITLKLTNFSHPPNRV